MQLTLTGEPADLAAFCQAVGRRTEERVTLYQTPKTALDYIEAAKTNTSIPPIRKPPKERTAMLEAIFAEYIASGLDAKTIKEHLAQEHDISMTGHQVCGWLGRMRQKANEKPKAGSESSEETSLQAPSEDATKEPTDGITINAFRETLQEVMTQGSKSKDGASLPWPGDLSEPDLTIWKMHVAGNMDIDIRQKLDRMGHPMRVSEIRKRIDELKMGQVKA